MAVTPAANRRYFYMVAIQEVLALLRRLWNLPNSVSVLVRIASGIVPPVANCEANSSSINRRAIENLIEMTLRECL